jgi:Ca2+-transporting ATPase
MQYAVLLSLVLLLLVVYVPFFQSVFNTVPLRPREWGLVLPLLLVPAVAAEITKAITRLIGRRTALAAA